jgi:hypothetical protein
MKTARAVAVCLAFVAAGCASQDAHPRDAASLSSVSPPLAAASVAAPNGYPPATYVGPLATPRHDAVGDVDLDVPLATDIPRISVVQAYAVCAQGEPGCTRDKGPTITLALVTTPNTGQANSDGSITPTMSRSLAYVLTWNDVGCPMGGPAGASHDTTPRYGCTAVNYVDANTGQSAYAYDG